MSKYYPLYNYLKSINKENIELSYNEIEDILGFSLPPSAYKYKSFWNKGKTHVWMTQIEKAGFRIDNCDLGKTILFVKGDSSTQKKESASKNKSTLSRKKIIKTFTQTDLDRAFEDVWSDTTYGEELKLIKNVFTENPLNVNRNIVAMKVGLIDITNSTNLSKYKSKISIPQLIDFIVNFVDLDKRIKEGDVSLIKELCEPIKLKYNIILFSFFSKYCCYHNMFIYNGDAFSIFDTILKDRIPDYIESVTKNKLETIRVTMDYLSYMKIIDKILTSNKIYSKNMRRKFDNFIWYYNR